MKLWKKRPLSVDLSSSSASSCAPEMPPSLSYISPACNRFRTNRCSMISTTSSNTDYLSSHSFAIAPPPLPSETFHEYRNTKSDYSTPSFITAPPTPAPSDLSIKSQVPKSYVAPISQNWHPVKDVLKIKRSASVPFRQNPPSSNTSNNNNNKENSYNVTEEEKVNVKKKENSTSFTNRLRVFFRNRSLSRSATIKEEETTKKNGNKNKKNVSADLNGLGHVSRGRLKESSTMDKLSWRHSTVGFVGNNGSSNSRGSIDKDFANRLDKVLQQRNKNDNGKHSNKTTSNRNRSLKTTPSQSSTTETITYIQPHTNKQPPSQQQHTPLLPFSPSVIAHTTSSAAKCKTPTPPSTTYNNRVTRKQHNHHNKTNKTQTEMKPKSVLQSSNSENYEQSPKKSSNQRKNVKFHDDNFESTSLSSSTTTTTTSTPVRLQHTQLSFRQSPSNAGTVGNCRKSSGEFGISSKMNIIASGDQIENKEKLNSRKNSKELTTAPCYQSELLNMSPIPTIADIPSPVIIQSLMTQSVYESPISQSIYNAQPVFYNDVMSQSVYESPLRNNVSSQLVLCNNTMSQSVYESPLYNNESKKFSYDSSVNKDSSSFIYESNDTYESDNLNNDSSKSMYESSLQNNDSSKSMYESSLQNHGSSRPMYESSSRNNDSSRSLFISSSQNVFYGDLMSQSVYATPVTMNNQFYRTRETRNSCGNGDYEINHGDLPITPRMETSFTAPSPSNKLPYQSRPRPISCTLQYPTNLILPPKSPYLSQYSKLYSLRVSEPEITPTQSIQTFSGDLRDESPPDYIGYQAPSIPVNRQLNCFISTSSNHATSDCYVIQGKSSIDSGLIEDISATSPEPPHPTLLTSTH